MIVSDPTIFGGKHFLVFATQDKGSGIDHYEVREVWWGWFRIAESPYLLQNQRLDTKITLKAIDKNGNERTSTVKAVYSMKWYEHYSLWGIIVALVGMTAVFVGHIMRRE